MLPLFDEDDEPEDTQPESPSRRKSRRHQANESISSINVRDILGATSGAEEEEEMVDTESKPKLNGISQRLASSHSRKSSLAYLQPEEPSMSLLSIASSSTATLRTLKDTAEMPQSRPAPEKPATKPPVRDVRSPSPDIDAILQATPRPVKLSGARSFSMSERRSKSNSLHSVKSTKSMRSIRGPGADEFGVMSTPMRLSKSTIGRKASTPFDPDESLNYIVDGVWDRHRDDEDEGRATKLERELDGAGSDSDDSSIDLHTPLP